MANRYHINKKGEAGKCEAEKGKCPFGGDENHFTSLAAARTAFEASQTTTSLSLKEMNAIAKTTDSAEEIENLIANGSDRTLANLVQNPNLVDADKQAILDRTTNTGVRASVFLSFDENGDFSKMTPEDAEEAAVKISRKIAPSGYYLDKKHFAFLMSKRVDDAIYQKIEKSPRISGSLKRSLPSVLSGENGISRQFVRQRLENNNWRGFPMNVDRALVNGKLTKQDLLDAPNNFIDHFSATGPSPILTQKEVDMLAEVAIERNDERLTRRVASDARTSSKSLSLLADRAPREVFENPDTDTETRNRIAARHASESYVRLAKVRDENPQDYKDLIASRATKSLNRSGTYNETSIQLDPALVRKHNLSQNDVMYLVGAEGYNAGGSYDEASGVVKLRVDSGD